MAQTIFKFPPDVYGFTTNASDKTVLAERKIFCKEKNLHPIFPLSDLEHIELEIRLSKKYGKEFNEYIGKFGDVPKAYKLAEAMNRKSYLLAYYMRMEENAKKTVSM